MAKVKTAPKVVLGLMVFGGLVAGFHYANTSGLLGSEEKASTSSETPNNNSNSGLAGMFGGSDSDSPIGSEGNPLKVSIVSFHGYAPALVANGNSLTTKPGSLFANKGVNVEFVIQDNVPTLAEIFKSSAQCAWRTSDFWAQEQPNLRGNNMDGRAVVVVDNTQGADAIIARDPSINSIEDLAGRSVALLQFTPSHGMLIDALENSSLSARKRQSVNTVFINVDEGTNGVRSAFMAGNVDAAALWDPDLSLALQAPGAHVIYSTKTASNLIYDVMVCDKAVLDTPAGNKAVQGLVAGWMEGVEKVNSNPSVGVKALMATEQFFQQLGSEQGPNFVQGLFKNIVLTGLADNVRILGLAGGTNHYERVYKRFDGIYRAAGALANPNAPVINPDQSFDYSFIRNLMQAAPSVRTEAQKPTHTFTAVEAKKVAKTESVVTKPVTINFATGKSDLNARGENTLDEEVAPMIENFGSAYFEISGNTDSTGSRALNTRLSLARARSVLGYLVKEWEFPEERFIVVGNGPDKPICDESNPGADGLSLDECRAANRTTRIAVKSSH